MPIGSLGMSTESGIHGHHASFDSDVHFASLVDNASQDELKLGLLRAVDHARKSSAEIATYKALLDDARGRIDELQRDLHRLSERLQQQSSETT